MDTPEEQLPDDLDAGKLIHEPAPPDGAAPHRNPIDEDLHADEPVVFGPDGSGEAADRTGPYGGGD